MSAATVRILHETRGRLRAVPAPGLDAAVAATRAAALAGVRAVRLNRRLGCVVVDHDGRAATRAAALAALSAGPDAGPDEATDTATDTASTRRPARPASSASGPASATLGTLLADWGPAAMAAVVPLLPRDLQRAGALAVVGGRVLAHPRRLAADPAATLLDAASLAALALAGHPGVASASVLMRTASERTASRLLGQADGLLDALLPVEAAAYPAADPDRRDRTPYATSALVPGDRIRLAAGDVVPVDGWVLAGHAALRGHVRPASRGDHLRAGEHLAHGHIELHVEAAAADSRLERMRAHVRHATAGTDPVGPLTPDLERMLALPLTGAAVVLGLTGDTARSAAMLQADPVQGLDLALPVAREAARVAAARRGLLLSGLEAIERLATARTLVLQDTGVLATGRWRIAAIRTEPGGHARQVRDWLATLAGWPGELPEGACLSDRQVRAWVREGGLLRVGEREVHLADGRRLRRVWGDAIDAATLAWADDGDGPEASTAGGSTFAADARHAPDAADAADAEDAADAPEKRDAARPDVARSAPRRRLAFVAQGRVVARVELASALRDDVAGRLAELRALGFERIAVVGEPGHSCGAVPAPGVERLGPGVAQRAEWIGAAGRTTVLVHTALRDLLPPGALGLCPVEGDAGSHGVLLGDPLASLVGARHLAQDVHRRLRRQRGAALTVNAALMTASALRWAPPIATAAVHHGFAALLLVDALRLARLGGAAPHLVSTSSGDTR
jgi:hypothetical protein